MSEAATETRPAAGRRGQAAVSAGVLALGIAFAAGTWLLPDAPGYAKVGPRLFPGLISAGLIVVGALLLFALATWILMMAWMSRHAYYGGPYSPPFHPGP